MKGIECRVDKSLSWKKQAKKQRKRKKEEEEGRGKAGRTKVGKTVRDGIQELLRSSVLNLFSFLPFASIQSSRIDSKRGKKTAVVIDL